MFRAKHHQHKLQPRQGWIVAKKNRLAVTWDFFLGFTPAERKKTFDAGAMIEFDWPAGSYKITGRTLQEIEDPKTGLIVSKYVLQLEAADF